MERSRDLGAATGVAFACLVHPASLGAVFCLLLNDHVLKGRAPGFVTGKLSDFAGLFFFPYLMALVVAVVSRAEQDRVRRWAFAVTAFWFAAAKTTVLGHDLTLAAVELLVCPSVIEPDATDVVALVSLVPAWRLWTRSAKAVPAGHRARVFATVLSAIACVATSSAGPRLQDFNSPAVLRVEADGSTVTAVVGPALSPENEGCQRFRREGAGRWATLGPCACPSNHLGVGRRDATGPGGIRFRLAGEEDAPGADVDPWMEYRPANTATRVVESRDGGVTWTTAWKISSTARVAASLVQDRQPHPDLRLVDLAVSVESGRVAAAFRTEGALVREPDGTWLQEPVGPVTPLASTRTASVAIAKLGDLKWWALAVFWLALGALAPAAWLGAGPRQWRMKMRTAYALAYLVAVGSILTSALLYPRDAPTLFHDVHHGLVLVAGTLVAVSPIITLVWMNRRHRAEAEAWSPSFRPSLAVVASLAALVLQTVLPFAGLSVRAILSATLFAGVAFVAQAFLAWRDAGLRAASPSRLV